MLFIDTAKNNNDIKDYLIQSIIEKHYSLWSCLKTTNNINSIVSELEKIISKIMINDIPTLTFLILKKYYDIVSIIKTKDVTNTYIYICFCFVYIVVLIDKLTLYTMGNDIFSNL